MADLTPQVSIDPNLGVARFGTAEIAIAQREAAIHVLPPNGPVVRQLSFGERNQVVWAAAGSMEPRLSLCNGVSNAAVVESGECDESILDAAALALAGAALDAPSFVESALLVAKASGWNPKEIGRMPAIDVDRMAAQLMPGRGDESGWNRIVFAPPGDSVDTLRDELADNLLHRAAISPSDRVAMADRGLQSDGARVLDGRCASQLGERNHQLPVGLVSKDAGKAHQEPSQSAAAASSNSVEDLGVDASTIYGDPPENSVGTDITQMAENVLPGTWRPDSSMAGRNGNEFPPSAMVKSAFADSEKYENPIAWDGLSTLPYRDGLAVSEQRPRSSQRNVLPESDSDVVVGPAIREAMQPIPGRIPAVFDANEAPIQFVAERLPSSGFVISADAIAEADAIAALLSQEADLRGIDR